MQIQVKDIWKNAWPHLIAIAVLFILNAAFFAPQYEGKSLNQNDIKQGLAMQGEILEYEEKTGDTYYWNNSMFVGMPFKTLVYGRDKNVARKVSRFFRLFQKRYIGMFLGMSLMTYFALALLGLRPWLACMGAIVMMLNVNHLVLLEAGHNNKIRAIANFPLILAGLLLCIQKGSLVKHLFGASIFGLGISLSLLANHPQMLYYFLMALFVFFVVRSLVDLKKIDLTFGRGLALLALGLILGIASNLTQIDSTLNTSKNTMRGEPILEKTSTASAGSSSSVKGLNWDYATQWSNGWKDVYSLVIPRAVGGGSAEEVSADSETGKLITRSGTRADKDGTVRAPMYWGDLPFTSGPYYIGAIVFFLFVLSFFLLPASWRWGFGISFFLILLISLGKNFESFNRVLFDHLPYYNKFRAPNSILHATAFLIIVPAILAVKEFWEKAENLNLKKTLYPALGIAGGFCLLLALLGPSLFDFSSAGDARYQEGVRDIFVAERKKLLRADALRSLFFMVAAAGVLWAFAQKYIKQAWVLLAALALLSTIDLWSVARRYMDAENWQRQRKLEASFPERPVDRQIKQMESGQRYKYRVHDLSINTFNTASTSYHHNTVGGYNAAKPQRIQDMIDGYISKGDANVLNMINAKYIIQPNGELQVNRNALGNAWMVQNIREVNTPEEEFQAVGDINPATTAIINVDDFGESLSGFTAGNGQGSISITDYTPDKITYQYSSPSEQLVVFSEAWYEPGWTATIDGTETDILRANYMLRALRVPAGEHRIVFEFEPAASYAGLTLISSIILLLLFLGSMIWYGLERLQESSLEVAQSTKKVAPMTKTKKKFKKKRKKK